MLWLTKHARLRNSLSPYLDGRLTSAEIKSLEAHLASCEGCRRELDELRATVSAVRELPQAEAPRSFAITPAMLERKTPALPPRSAPLFGTGMRIAGAAVAVALTVVVVGDLTFGDNEGASREAGSQPAAESRTTAEFDAGLNAEKSSDDAAAQGGATASAADAGATASCPSTTQSDSSTTGGGAGGAGGPASGGGAGGGAGEAPPATATVEPAPQPTPPSPAPGAAAICGDTLSDSGAAVPAAPQTPPASSAEPSTPENDVTTRAASASSDDGSISMIRVAEIALAATLVLLLAGIVIETTKRRRPSP